VNRDTTLAAPGGKDIPNNHVQLYFGAPQSFNNCEISLTKATLYSSWYNISAKIGNNTISYSIPNGDDTVNLTLPDGTYQITDINNFIHADMHNRGYYFKPVSPAGVANATPIYPINIVADPITYRVSMQFLPLSPPPNPTYQSEGDDPPDYSWALNPDETSPDTPKVYIADQGTNFNAGGSSNTRSSMSRVLGFAPGTYPDPNDGTLLKVTGTYTPTITLQNLIMFSCNVANDPNMVQYSQVIGQFIPVGSSGELMSFEDQNPSWHPVSDNMYTYIDLWITDEHLLPIDVQDPIMTVSCQVRQRTAIYN